MIKSKKMNLVEALVATPNLSSALYILYWNLDLNAKALRELGDLRLLVQKKEARSGERMMIKNVGHLKELIQGLDDDINIEVDYGGAYYDIDDGLLLFNNGADNKSLLSLTLKKIQPPF